MVGPCGPGAHGLPLTTCWGKKKILGRKLETIWDFMLEDKNQRG